MNNAERERWLRPSPPLAVDEDARVAHVMRVRDMRARFGDEEAFRAECSCGWKGELHHGRLPDRVAQREGLVHLDDDGRRDGRGGRTR
jgi:Xaa-Pro aminopeptidase